jgi:probable rRNA maturation factor
MMRTTKRSASERGEAGKRRNHRAKKEPAETITALPVEVVNRQRLYALNRREIAQLSRQVLDRVNRLEASATISFIRDPAMRRLNRTYRGLDAPTDVLSFASRESSDQGDPGFDPAQLGDVIISVETAARYAQKFGLTFENEIRTLVIHGTLHLAGYDHETDNGEMNRLERRLRKELMSRHSGGKS